MVEERGCSVLDLRSLDRDPPEALHCVLEQDNLSVRPKKTDKRSETTEQLLTGSYTINANKETKCKHNKIGQ